MNKHHLFIGLFVAATTLLSACGNKTESMTNPTTIQPAENKMVVLPANMTLAQAVIHPPRSQEGFGTLEQQTIGAFNGLHALLRKQGLTLGNVMSVRAVLAPNTEGIVDYDSYLGAYKKFFGTKKLPTTPLHSINAIQSFPVNGQLIMLEANIAMPAKSKPQKEEQ